MGAPSTAQLNFAIPQASATPSDPHPSHLIYSTVLGPSSYERGREAKRRVAERDENTQVIIIAGEGERAITNDSH